MLRYVTPIKRIREQKLSAHLLLLLFYLFIKLELGLEFDLGLGLGLGLGWRFYHDFIFTSRNSSLCLSLILTQT